MILLIIEVIIQFLIGMRWNYYIWTHLIQAGEFLDGEFQGKI